MHIVFYVGIGGFAGAVMRYLIAGWVQDLSRSLNFAFGTLAVNLIGCFLIGLLTYLVDFQGILNPEARMAVLVGVLGAFTTFSTFSYETLSFLQDGAYFYAGLNILLHNLFGLFAVWLGRTLAYMIWR